MKLSSFGKNIYSQFGEDGIIEKVFEIIGCKSKVCIEFGAWDGFHCSNTANLWTNGWKGILIEGDEQRSRVLKKNIKSYNCIDICRYVGTSDINTLENILKDNNIYDKIDLLSIDIDGDDYYILSSLSELRPRVIICEYNHTIPYWMDVYQKHGEYFGASVGALKRIAKEKGYELISITDGSCIFVQECDLEKFGPYNTNISDIVIHKYLNNIITDYSGKYLVCGEFPFGINKKYSTANIVNGSNNITFNEGLFVINLNNLRSSLASLYYNILKPISIRICVQMKLLFNKK